jgi:FAD/FMN-containing dehydrogenase
MAQFESIKKAQHAIRELRKLPELPSALEMVDGGLLELSNTLNPHQLKGIIDKPYPPVVLLIEFDSSERTQKKLVKQTQKILQKYALESSIETELDKQEQLWKVRTASAAVTAHAEGGARAIPVIEDGIVPVEKLEEYIAHVRSLLTRNHVRPALWGHAGDANLHVRPYLDLGQLGDRQKVFRLMDEYYNLVVSLGGSTSGEHNDGRLRAPYLPLVYGAEIYSVLLKIKQIFDPYGTLNPGVKVGVELNDIKPLMRDEYSLRHVYEHLPHS